MSLRPTRRCCSRPFSPTQSHSTGDRTVLSTTERKSLLSFPDTDEELIRHYTLNESDLALIRQRRGAANRLRPWSAGARRPRYR
ncbi:DUF4158 domain-containing protein [Cupriavidus necator]|uniref:DUF4158 domain-containing protein n=1 Tax=Cupriavidus necator TaxID=106590 RepID=UPI0009C00C94